MRQWLNDVRLRALVVIVLTMVAVPMGEAAHAQGLWLATWKVDLAKSTYPSGPPPFKRMICTIELWDGNVRVTYDIVGTRGGVTHIEWIGAFDGRDHPVAGIDGYVITHAYRRIDDRTFDVVQKTEGGATSTARMTVSPDGKTLTTVTPGADPRDLSLVTTTVYDRQ